MDSLIATVFEFSFGLIGAFFVWIFKRRREPYWLIFRDRPLLNIVIGVAFTISIAAPLYFINYS